MPPAEATQSSEKRSTSSGTTQAARTQAPQSTEAQRPRTRSASETAAQVKQASKYKDARKFLDNNCLLAESSACTPQSLASVLLLMSTNYKMPDNVIKVLEHMAAATLHMESHCQGCNRAADLLELLKGMKAEISSALDKKLETLECKLVTSLPIQEQLNNATKEIEQAAASIKSSISEMGSSFAKVTDTSSQLESTISTYRDALTNNSTQAHPKARPSPADPKVLRDVDRKARQILIDTTDEKIRGASLAEIKEKVRIAIEAVIEPPPPKDTTVIEIGKLCNGGFTVLFKDKGVVKWLQDPATELAFTSEIAPDATIKQHLYTLLVPRIPITFDPASEGQLREIEENNDLPTGTLVKARWIKPISRRNPEQRAAHAAFTFKDVNITNFCIRDGLYVCGMRTRPSRLKHEPMQCMKCRRWGHFAHSCLADIDTCVMIPDTCLFFFPFVPSHSMTCRTYYSYSLRTAD